LNLALEDDDEVIFVDHGSPGMLCPRLRFSVFMFMVCKGAILFIPPLGPSTARRVSLHQEIDGEIVDFGWQTLRKRKTEAGLGGNAEKNDAGQGSVGMVCLVLLLGLVMFAV
jgi:hypothetical protein